MGCTERSTLLPRSPARARRCHFDSAVAQLDELSEFRQRQVKGDSKPVHNAEGWLLARYLQQADKWTVELRPTRQIFLGQSQFGPARLEGDGQSLKEKLVSTGPHCPMVCSLYTLDTCL